MATQPLKRSTGKPAQLDSVDAREAPPVVPPLDAGDGAESPELAPQRRWRTILIRILTRRDGRAPVWLELIVVLWLLWLYDQINNLAPLRRIVALHNAASVLALERSL
ncbi:MAG TPA: hypothetical protein VN845_05915, partial [Solirubrobacteraceae bacterium]|nr:hypothetical protein [Solirubrobacteraceae bacterium]